MCGVLMAASLLTVATGKTLTVQLVGKGGFEGGRKGREREEGRRRCPPSSSPSPPPFLPGVGFCSLQAGIGEASMLGLTAQYHGPSTITAWSSGTGFAGILGR